MVEPGKTRTGNKNGAFQPEPPGNSGPTGEPENRVPIPDQNNYNNYLNFI